MAQYEVEVIVTSEFELVVEAYSVENARKIAANKARHMKRFPDLHVETHDVYLED